MRGGREVTLGNQWAVPYNPYLTRKYDAHINVEICASVHAVKYITKYIYKGPDRTTMKLDSNRGEVKAEERHLERRARSIELRWQVI